MDEFNIDWLIFMFDWFSIDWLTFGKLTVLAYYDNEWSTKTDWFDMSCEYLFVFSLYLSLYPFIIVDYILDCIPLLYAVGIGIFCILFYFYWFIFLFINKSFFLPDNLIISLYLLCSPYCCTVDCAIGVDCWVKLLLDDFLGLEFTEYLYTIFFIIIYYFLSGCNINPFEPWLYFFWKLLPLVKLRIWLC